MKISIFLAIVACAAVADTAKVLYKLTRLNQADAIFSCTSGKMPNITTAQNPEDSYLILSCK